MSFTVNAIITTVFFINYNENMRPSNVSLWFALRTAYWVLWFIPWGRRGYTFGMLKYILLITILWNCKQLGNTQTHWEYLWNCQAFAYVRVQAVLRFNFPIHHMKRPWPSIFKQEIPVAIKLKCSSGAVDINGDYKIIWRQRNNSIESVALVSNFRSIFLVCPINESYA